VGLVAGVLDPFLGPGEGELDELAYRESGSLQCLEVAGVCVPLDELVAQRGGAVDAEPPVGDGGVEDGVGGEDVCRDVARFDPCEEPVGGGRVGVDGRVGYLLWRGRGLVSVGWW
jgi:hypothetical protein